MAYINVDTAVEGIDFYEQTASEQIVQKLYFYRYTRAVEKEGAGGRQPTHHFLEQKIFLHVKSENINFRKIFACE